MVSNKVINTIQLKLEPENYFLPHNVYDSDILGDYISKTEFESLISDADKVISLSWISKRKYDRLVIPKWIYVLSFLSAVCFVAYLLLMYFAPRHANGITLYYVGIGFCAVGIIIAVALSIYNFAKKVTVGKDLEVFICEGLEGWCNNINKSINENIAFSYDKDEKVLICLVYSQINQPQVFKSIREIEEPFVHQDNNSPQKYNEMIHNRSKTQKSKKKSFVEYKKNV